MVLRAWRALDDFEGEAMTAFLAAIPDETLIEHLSKRFPDEESRRMFARKALGKGNA